MKRHLLAMLLACALPAGAFAHEVRTAYLELRESAPDTYDALWKVPAREGNLRLAVYVELPDDARPLSEPRGRFTEAAFLERWRFVREGGLGGQTLRIAGLSASRVDALIRLTSLDGRTQTLRATPDAPSVTIPRAASNWSVAGTYTVLGIEHILLGVDHLVFVLALLLLVRGWKRLVETITAFSVAHSITLAAATLGLVQVPGAPVEACIALSIGFVATEILRDREAEGFQARAAATASAATHGTGATGRVRTPSLAARAPWLVAFAFGLLHGLGFAGALREVGLPDHAIPLSLLFFNVGVELGQLAFVGVVLGTVRLVRRLPVHVPAWGWRVAPYAIGAVAMFWVIERTAGFLP